mmetsp:Transcript_89706/g.267586  ORF Transcript_89706/g.267586 Transcript_89706/m.267586 type:complete len:351 (-) Transcript_89706:823-1875(-)
MPPRVAKVEALLAPGIGQHKVQGLPHRAGALLRRGLEDMRVVGIPVGGLVHQHAGRHGGTTPAVAVAEDPVSPPPCGKRVRTFSLAPRAAHLHGAREADVADVPALGNLSLGDDPSARAAGPGRLPRPVPGEGGVAAPGGAAALGDHAQVEEPLEVHARVGGPQGPLQLLGHGPVPRDLVDQAPGNATPDPAEGLQADRRVAERVRHRELVHQDPRAVVVRRLLLLDARKVGRVEVLQPGPQPRAPPRGVGGGPGGGGPQELHAVEEPRVPAVVAHLHAAGAALAVARHRRAVVQVGLQARGRVEEVRPEQAQGRLGVLRLLRVPEGEAQHLEAVDREDEHVDVLNVALV